MYELIIHDDAVQDLREIIKLSKSAGLRIFALIEELKDDQDLLDRLTQHKFGGKPSRPAPSDADFNISMWVAMQQKGHNLWRVRFFDPIVDGYRIVYGYYPGSDVYVILGVFKKSKANKTGCEYDSNNSFARRISYAYQELGDELR